MPVTTLWITDDNKNMRLMFMTQQFEENVMSLRVYQCTEDFLPVGVPVRSSMLMDEGEYHTKLRAEAEAKGHFIPAHSTDPQWSPGYVPGEDENIDTTDTPYTC